MQLVPIIFSPVPNCCLHVVNNDTGEEIEMIKVVPHVYKPNKVCRYKNLFYVSSQSTIQSFVIFTFLIFFSDFALQLGYTFVAEVVKPGLAVSDSKWRMRLIGLKEPLPKLSREVPVSAFSVKQFQDYYIPSDKNLICR